MTDTAQLGVQVNVDTQQGISELQKLTAKIVELETELKNLKSNTNSPLPPITDSFETGIKNTVASASSLINEINKAKQANNGIFKPEEVINYNNQINNLKTQINSLLNSLRTVDGANFYNLQTNTGSLANALTQVNQELNNVKTNLPQVENNVSLLDDATKRLAATFGLAQLAGAVSNLIQHFAEFDNAIRRAAATAGVGESGIQGLVDAVNKVGPSLGVTITETAKGLTSLTQAGFSTTDAINNLSSSIKFADIAEMSLNDAVLASVQIVNGYGLSLNDLKSINDKIIAVSDNTTASVRSLATGFSYVAGLASQANQSFDETVKNLGLLSNANYDAERGGTALRRALSELINPTAVSREALAKLNVTVRDSTGELKPLTDILADLKNKSATAGDYIKIFGDIAGTAMLALANSTKDSQQQIETAISTSLDSIDKKHKLLTDGVDGELKKFTAEWDRVKNTFTNSYEPAINFTLDTLTKGFKLFYTEASLGTQKAIEAFTSLGTSLLALKSAATVFPALTANATAFGTAMLGLPGVIVTATTALAAWGIEAGFETAGMKKLDDAASNFVKTANAVNTTVKSNIPTIQELNSVIEKSATDYDKKRFSVDNVKTALKDFNIQNGLNITSIKELNTAINNGTVIYDKQNQIFITTNHLLAETNKYTGLNIKSVQDIDTVYKEYGYSLEYSNLHLLKAALALQENSKQQEENYKTAMSLKNELTVLAETYKTNIEVEDKKTESSKKQLAVQKTVIESLNNEIEKNNQLASNSQATADLVNKSYEIKKQAADNFNSKLVQLNELIPINGALWNKLNDDDKNIIITLKEKADKLNETAEKTKFAAQESQLLADKQNLLAITTKDNSDLLSNQTKIVEELTKKKSDLIDTINGVNFVISNLDKTTKAYNDAIDVQNKLTEELTALTKKLNTEEKILNDTRKDAITNSNAVIDKIKLENKEKTALIDLQIQEANNTKALAQERKNENAVKSASINIYELQIEKLNLEKEALSKTLEEKIKIKALEIALIQQKNISNEQKDLEIAKINEVITALQNEITAKQLSINLANGQITATTQQTQTTNTNTEATANNTEATDENTNANNSNATATKKNTEAIKEEGGVLQVVLEWIKKTTDSMYSLSKGTGELFVKLTDTVPVFGNWIKQLGEAHSEADNLEKKIKILGNNLFNSFLNEAKAVDELSASLQRIQTASLDAELQFYKQKQQAENLSNSLKDITTANDFVVKGFETTVNSLDLLDEQTLDNLKSEIDRVKEATQQLNESIKDTVETFRDDFLQQIGDKTAIELLKYEEDLQKIGQLMAQATTESQKQALKQASYYAEQSHKIRMQEIADEQAKNEATAKLNAENVKNTTDSNDKINQSITKTTDSTKKLTTANAELYNTIYSGTAVIGDYTKSLKTDSIDLYESKVISATTAIKSFQDQIKNTINGINELTRGISGSNSELNNFFNSVNSLSNAF